MGTQSSKAKIFSGNIAAHCEVMGHYSELCKNGLTNGDAILIEDLGGPKELCIRWGAAAPRGRGNFWGLFGP